MPVEVETFVDCRYAGQSHELTVAEIDEFPAEHARRNGYARPGIPVEVVALRARARGVAPLDPSELPDWARDRVVGPAVAAEPDCTVWVPEGWTADPAPDGTWILTRGSS
jgi:5-oxoprolinase (ATP-hydrolysing)